MSKGRGQDLIQPAEPRSLSRAVEILRSGGVIAYPTETFYGLGCRAQDKEAVERIFGIKGRAGDKPLPLIVADEEMAFEVARTGGTGLRGTGLRGTGLAGLAADLAKIFWPGPLTLLLQARQPFPPGVAPEAKVALRVSSHPTARALARNLNSPLVSTSANLSGEPPATLASQVEKSLAQNPPDLILKEDPCTGGQGTTILDLTVVPPRILRAGAVAEKELEPFLRGWA